MVRGTVEEALNAMLAAEADRLYGASKYERTEGRKDTSAGSYERSLDTKAGSTFHFRHKNGFIKGGCGDRGLSFQRSNKHY